MGLLDEAIREHLELKRKHGADEAEIARQESEAFGPGPEQGEADPDALDAPAEEQLDGPPDRAAEAGITGDREEPEFEWQGFGSDRLEVPDYVTGGDQEGADDETRVDVGGTEAGLEEERPPEVTDAPTELFQPLDADRSEGPEDELEEPAVRTAGEAPGDELSSASASQDETMLYEAPPAEDEEPAAEEPELGGEAPEDASEAVEEPLEVSEAIEEEALAVAEPIEEAEPPPEEAMEAPPAAETVIEGAMPEEELEAAEHLEHERAAEEEPLERARAGDDVGLGEGELAEETDLPELSASLEPSPFARPEEPAEAFGPEPAEEPGDDSAEAEPVVRSTDEEGWDQLGIVEEGEGEPEAPSAPEDTAYLPPQERPLYEPVPDAESRPEEPLDIPPPATELEPVSEPEPEPLAEAGDTELGAEPADAELAPEPAQAEPDVPEPDIASEEGGDEADPSPSRGFFEDTAEYEGIPPERRPPRDPDFES